jgi:hypothetical protein
MWRLLDQPEVAAVQAGRVPYREGFLVLKQRVDAPEVTALYLIFLNMLPSANRFLTRWQSQSNLVFSNQKPTIRWSTACQIAWCSSAGMHFGNDSPAAGRMFSLRLKRLDQHFHSSVTRSHSCQVAAPYFRPLGTTATPPATARRCDSKHRSHRRTVRPSPSIGDLRSCGFHMTKTKPFR